MQNRTSTRRKIWLEAPHRDDGLRLLVSEPDAPVVEDAWRRIPASVDPASAVRALIDSLGDRVSTITLDSLAQLAGASRLGAPGSQLARGQATGRELPALALAAQRGSARLLLSFGGQAQDYWPDLEALHGAGREVRAVVERCADALRDELAGDLSLMGLHPHGLDLLRWLREPESRPPAKALAGSPLSQPLIFVTQVARLRSLRAVGLPPGEIARWAVATTGHSQGIAAAAFAAQGLEGEAFLEGAALVSRYLAWQGVRMQVSWGRGRNGRAPMVAITGLEVEDLERRVSEVEGLTLALVNAPRRAVLSGEPADLARFVQQIERSQERASRSFQRGEGPPPSPVTTEGLAVGAPFHSPAMARAHDALRTDARNMGLALDPSSPVLPLLRYEDGAAWQGEPNLISSMCFHRVDWQATMAAARQRGVTHVVDLGPGAGVATLSALCLQGHGVRVLAAATEAGQALLHSRDPADSEPPRPWAERAPRVRQRADGTLRLENAFTRATGCAPVMLPGMTPTTVDAPIVAAAANAGFLAELAGGGQPTEATLRRRSEQLRSQLAPGEGYVFNALYLDSYLWKLHLAEQRLVQRLKAEGHPILGVTITAGLPPVDECVALLRELRELGMDLNSLKVGSDAQIEQALQIADADPDALLVLQIEGGRAGGHHGFEELPELLVRWYARIRRRPRLLLAVGGGVATPEQVQALLSGAWSEARGLAPMPVDAVFLGTVAMAAQEAGTSPAVKRALAAAPGVDRLLARGVAVGGVRSGRSGLGADVHYLDNHAARTAALLDEVAGDHEAAAARRDEIAAALARTARPWIGDLAHMSYLALLRRMSELMALGDGSAESDGPWLDPSHRERFLRMLRRSLRRCGWRAPLPTDGRLDDPEGLLCELVQACPELATTPVLLEDERYFVERVCRGPGKPVPFVPLIDGDVHRWFSSDSLWQSHDERYDAEAVLVLPGPAALAGIERVDEPVAQLLERYLEPSRAQAGEADADPGSRVDPVTQALAATTCLLGLRERANPLPALLEAAHGRARLEALSADRVRLVLEHPVPGAESVELELPFELRLGHRVALRASEDLPARLRAFYGAVMPIEARFDQERLAAWRRTVSDDADGEPLQLAFARALPGMMRSLLGGALAADPLSLLHVEGEIRRLCPESDGPREVRVAEPQLADGPGGRQVCIEAEIFQRGRPIVGMAQSFLVQRVHAPLPEGAVAPSSDPDLLEGAVRLERPRLLLDAELSAPVDMAAFAAASGDFNPIHRDPALAWLAGLEGPIVHGQWAASAACALLTAGGRRLDQVRTRYLAPMLPGGRLRCLARVVARLQGDEIVEVELRAGETLAVAMTARLAAPVTAVVFPGQGCQRPGMGMEGYERSAAARRVWDRAERYTREQLGFSLLEAVRDNPRELDVGGEVLRHPQGVLNATQITQVALAVLACAQVAELREDQLLPPLPWSCGHSIGEYAALASLGGVLELEAVVDLVFHRGTTMQRFVPRDEQGRSPYTMGVVRPHRVGLDGERLIALVERIAREQGQPLFVVNHNIRDKQYAVAGQLQAVAALTAALDEAGEGGWVELPGLDVPFHSPLLREGVAAFREVLDRCFAQEMDLRSLVGRYIPNLVARPFVLEPDFVQAVIDVTGTAVLDDALLDPSAHARTLLIELLAWQFASPVRWIETQDLLIGQVQRVLEVGPGEAPVLVNMLARTQDASGGELELLHTERDREAVLGLGEEQVEEAPVVAAIEPASEAAAAPSAIAAPLVEDAALPLGEALRLVLALATGRSLVDFDGSASLDELLGGNSARRNQVLADLGKELGAPPVDGAHELPLPELVAVIQRAVGPRYRHPGAYLRAVRDRALSQWGRSQAELEASLQSEWGLPPGRRAAVLSFLALQLRSEGGSDDSLDQALQRYAAREGLTLQRRAAQSASAGPAMDPEAVEAVGRQARGRWAGVARVALSAAGLDPALVDRVPKAPALEAPRTVDKRRDLGLFDARRHVAFTAAATWARADALRWYHQLLRGENPEGSLERLVRAASPELVGVLDHLARRARRAGHGEAAAELERCAKRARRGAVALPWVGETALVTGAGPGSIAEAVVADLLAGGARVVATTFPIAEPRRAAIDRLRALYRRWAAAGAELHLVPLDQGRRDDVDALCSWLVSSGSEQRGARRVRTKEPWLPTLCFPFAAAPAEGDPTDVTDWISHTLQVNLVGVERLVGGLARETAKAGREAPRVHVVLPLSPNHGQVGRDGLYAESKAGLEALLHRWRSEQDRWGRRVTLVGARMGWVRGTGLMGGLDAVWRTVEAELGILTYANEDMARLLLEHCDAASRRRAAEAPVIADLTGGFGRAAEGLREVIERALRAGSRQEQAEEAAASQPLPLPLFAFPPLPAAQEDAGCSLDPSQAVAVVGFGEVGPFGNERVRWALEKDGALSPEAALELAWLCGLVRAEAGSWVDAESGEVVDPGGLDERYSLGERIGIRQLQDPEARQVETLVELRLEQDLVFTVPDEALARSLAVLEPDTTEIFPDGEGAWTVLRRAGSRVRLPRAASMSRSVGGLLPEGWDPTRLGLDSDQVQQIDPVAAFNLLATAEAFRCAGTQPEELWSALHPSRIGSTQGGGLGGMRAMRRLYVDPVLDRQRQTDALQEALINVSPAWAASAFHGGYGPMAHPVGACATAAVSVELGVDLILSGKADLVVAGAYDDLGVEGRRGFADMGATISDVVLQERGMDPDQASRPCDARRAGFVEAQGGGTLLLCRADKALELGLPIYGLVAGAWSRGDGIQPSIPAPGRGLLGVAAGGPGSPLGRALGAYGLVADDVGAVSIHGTSTEANDLNEVDLHASIALALGRDPGNPLPVIGQKALTGHSKGGAAAWQTIGLLQAMTEGVIPAMPNLDEPDPGLARRLPLCFPDEPVRVGPGALRAALLTSLGFGHVGAMVCLVHADVLLESLPQEQLRSYCDRRQERWRRRLREQHEVLLGERPLFESRAQAALSERQERAMLLEPR